MSSKLVERLYSLRASQAFACPMKSKGVGEYGLPQVSAA